MRDLPAGTVTLLFTDIEGSTRLLRTLGSGGYADALAEHRRILREAFGRHQGAEVDTQGDAFFVAFASARDAAAAAAQAQAALAGGPIRVRMGLHTGTPAVTDEGFVGEDAARDPRELTRVRVRARRGQIVVAGRGDRVRPARGGCVDARPVCTGWPDRAESRGMVRPLTTAASSAPRVCWREGVESRLHGDGATTICVLEQWIAPGAGAPTHVHHESEELILVVAGTAEFWAEGSAETLDEGSSIVIPAGTRHGFRNAGAGELHTIATFPTAHPTVEYEREPGRIYEIRERHRRAEDAP